MNSLYRVEKKLKAVAEKTHNQEILMPNEFSMPYSHSLGKVIYKVWTLPRTLKEQTGKSAVL